MEISELVAPVADASASTNAGASESLGREDFLAMLIAQLENQDPLDPQDATEFTAQLAQFSSLDQLISMRTSIDALAAAQTSSQSLAAVSLIGREALVASSEFSVSPNPDQPLPKLFLEAGAPTEVQGIEILDASGRVVSRSDSIGRVPAGRSALDWSVFSSIPAPGQYSVRVTPAPGAASPSTLVQARITGATLEGASPVLLVERAEVPLDALVEVRE